MTILFIGDIFGSPGRKLVLGAARDLAQEHRAELGLAHPETPAAGYGIPPARADELLDAGIDVLTGGNHTFDRKEILPYLEQGAAGGRVLRPANYPNSTPGRGLSLGPTVSGTRYAVLNLQGRVFMASIDCPFKTADRLRP